MKNKLDWLWFERNLCKKHTDGKYYIKDNIAEDLLIEAMVRGFAPEEIASHHRLKTISCNIKLDLEALKQLSIDDGRWQTILEKVAGKK
jgi:hypothetical protein